MWPLESARAEHAWHNTSDFGGIVADRGQLEVRSVRKVARDQCSVMLNTRVALDDSLLKQISKAAGLQVVDTRPVLLVPYRAEEGIGGEIEAEFSFQARGARFLLLSPRGIGKRGSLRIG